ncbi:MAG: glycosyltransferase family 4 protein [Ideonella sp.]|jgi:UDP-glucose:(heptosyl)LPS alpha-1,3-glucosyltransferase|nr:glycosyltransferase family 4 protein [Ideonella sp.]
MHVAVIHPKYTPFGGGARMIDEIVRALAARGARVTMLVREWSGARPEGVEVQVVDPFHLGSTWRDWSFERAMTSERLSGFDLVVSDQKIPGIDVYIAGGGCHREFVATRQRRSSVLQRMAMALNAHTRYTAQAESRLFASGTLKAVICVSGRVRDDLERWYGVDPARLHVVYNGIDLSRFDPVWRDENRQRLRREHGIGDRLTFAFIGGGWENKGLEPVLRALARSGLDFVLFVVGKDRRQARFTRLAQRLGIAGRCRFVGPQVDVRPWYAMADATVLASFFETFGLVGLESLAMGVPVVVSRHAGVAELIEDGVHGWRVEPDDVEDVARGLQAAAHADRARLAPPCRALAERHQSTAMLHDLAAVFESLGAERHAIAAEPRPA